MRDTFSNTQHRLFREESQAILTAMRAVYWLAKEDYSNSQIGLTAQFSG